MVDFKESLDYQLSNLTAALVTENGSPHFMAGYLTRFIADLHEDLKLTKKQKALLLEKATWHANHNMAK